eukprot:SAG25_NODE_6212_length_578_cov_1.192067_2_plen_29_part_01
MLFMMMSAPVCQSAMIWVPVARVTHACCL